MATAKEIAKRRRNVSKYDRKGLNAPQIATELGINIRTIERDLIHLNSSRGLRTDWFDIAYSLDYKGLNEEQKQNFISISKKYLAKISENSLDKGYDHSLKKELESLLTSYKTSCKREKVRAKKSAKNWSEGNSDGVYLEVADVVLNKEFEDIDWTADWKIEVLFNGYLKKIKEFPQIFYDFCRINRTFPRIGAHETENLWDALHDATLLFIQLEAETKEEASELVITKRQVLAKASRIYTRKYKYKQGGLTARGTEPVTGRRLHIINKLDNIGDNMIEKFATDGETPATILMESE